MMQQKEISFTLQQYAGVAQLKATDRELVLQARSAAKRAYNPYSHYAVGAAIRLADGQILTGNNQENASFPAGICAEQVVLAYANANWPKEAVNSIAISAINTDGQPAAIIRPCGICRQVMVEVEKKFDQALRVIMDGQSGIEIVEQARQLLPLTFDDLDHLITTQH